MIPQMKKEVKFVAGEGNSFKGGELHFILFQPLYRHAIYPLGNLLIVNGLIIQPLFLSNTGSQMDFKAL